MKNKLIETPTWDEFKKAENLQPETMKTLTLEDFKNDEVINLGYSSYKHYVLYTRTEHEDAWPSHQIELIERAAEKFANYRAEQAAIAQRIICAENATIVYHTYVEDGGEIDKDSILNAPLSTDEK